MNILFILPPKTSSAIKGLRLHEIINEEAGIYPPLGMMYVASYLKKRLCSSCTIKIIDAIAENMSYENILDQVIKINPDIVGIYFCTLYLHDALRTAKLIKDINKNIIVVAGGPHTFIYPEQTIKEKVVDYCIYGEGEKSFSDLVMTLAGMSEKATSPDDIPGVISSANVNKAMSLQKVENLDDLPFPDRKMLPIHKYRSFITYSNPVTTMMTSRGCAFNCYYCNNIERAQKVRLRSAINVISEIEDILKLGIRDIIFFDENFTYDVSRVRDICDEIVRRRIKIRWHCRSRADMKLDKPLLQKMKDAGCRLIQIGIETGTPRLQKVINKNLNLEQVKRTIRAIKDVGILTYGNFMLGLPSETLADMENTIKFATEIDLDYAPFGIFNPLPESVFYKEGLRSGLIKKDYWREFAENPTERMVDYCWPEFDKVLLEEMNMVAFRRFYLRPSYILKAIFRRQSLSQKLWQARSALKLFLR